MAPLIATPVKDGRPSDYQTQIYSNGLKGIKPPFPFNVDAWPSLAKDVLPRSAWGYVHGDAGSRSTDDNNLAAFKKWGLVPRRLRRIERVDMGVEVLGMKIPCPILLAPVGVLQIFHEDKENGVARAARETGVPYIMSSASATSIEECARENRDGVRFFQLYWPSRDHDELTISILNRAKKAGFSALMVTLDTFRLGWRPDDEDVAFNPFLKPDNIGVEIGFSDPVYQKLFKEKHGKEIHEDKSQAAQEWAKTIFPGVSQTWDDLEFFKTHWDGPIVLKGIQCVEDAQEALERGMAGIVVSNHGGRQVDGSIASLDVLPEIAEAIGDKIDICMLEPVYLFGHHGLAGVRCGADVAKALALGAKAVLIGRPYVYGLSFGGQAGVEHVLRSTLAELEMTLELSGIASVSKRDLNKGCLRRI